jgi:pimeloyl-ACP methyl ester carboxylesterase
MLADIAGRSTDSALTAATLEKRFPAGDGQTAVELIIDPARFHDVFTADLPQLDSDVYGLSQRPIAASAFAEPTGHPAWKDLPSWAAVGTADKAAGSDVVRSMAQRAGATITEIEGSHVIMISQPDAVTEVILTALKSMS